MPSFAQRFFELAKERSPLCLGLDPSRDLIRDWGLKDDADSIRRFCGVVMDAAADRVAVVKPQSGFFERLGPSGLSELARAVGLIRERGALSIIDCKRGDVHGTMEGYAEAMLGADSGFSGNAMTVTAYLGFGALRPVFDRAVQHNASVFVIVRSSNPEGRALQDAKLADGPTVPMLWPTTSPPSTIALGTRLDQSEHSLGPPATRSRPPHSLVYHAR